MAAASLALSGRWAMPVLGRGVSASIHNGLGLVPRDSVQLFPYTLSEPPCRRDLTFSPERRCRLLSWARRVRRGPAHRG